MRMIVAFLIAIAMTVGGVACSSSAKSTSTANSRSSKECAAANEVQPEVAALRKNPSTAAAQGAKMKATAEKIAASPPPGYEDGAKQFAALLTTVANKLTAPTDSTGVETVLAPIFATGLNTGQGKYGLWAILTCGKN